MEASKKQEYEAKSNKIVKELEIKLSQYSEDELFNLLNAICKGFLHHSERNGVIISDYSKEFALFEKLLSIINKMFLEWNDETKSFYLAHLAFSKESLREKTSHDYLKAKVQNELILRIKNKAIESK